MLKRFTTKKEKSLIDEAIDSCIVKMLRIEPDSKEYAAMADNLEKLYKAKAHARGAKVSPDTMAIIAANLLGIGLILGFEKFGIVASKALGFVIKGRV